MRPCRMLLAVPLLLGACAGEAPAPAPPLPVVRPTRAQIVFPSTAEVNAGRPIQIRPAASFGLYGPLQPMPGAPSCGVLQDSQTNRVLAVASVNGPVTPVFDIGGRCTRPDATRGLPFVRMERAWILPDGIYLQGPREECFLPNVGRTSACVPRYVAPPTTA